MKKLFKEIQLFFIILTDVRYWFSIKKVNKEYDKFLRNLIKNKSKIKKKYSYTCYINNNEIWVSNYPYAFGGLCSYKNKNFKSNIKGLPSRRTRILLKEYLNKNGIEIN